MKSEWNDIGNEFHGSTELHQPKDLSGIVPIEFLHPQNEFTDCGCEFVDLQNAVDKSEASKENAERKKKEQKKKAGEKLVRKMSYTVVCAVTTLTLSGTLDVIGTIQENVLQAGGSIDGDLRFSIQWNDKDSNPNDFDAHCLEPSGYEIYFGNMGYESPSKGMLDVDIVSPGTNVAVENIVYADKSDISEGTYKFFVHNFSHNGGKSGFSAEIEMNGRVYEFEYDKELLPGENVIVAEVTWENGRFTIDKKIE